MAYRQKVSRIDVRNLPIDKTTSAAPSATLTPSAIKQLESHSAGRDVLRVLVVAVPLILILVLASYFDHSRGWVVDFATWLFALGR